MKKFFKSFGYALRGIATGLREERNLKVQMAIAVLTIIAGFYFSITTTEWIIILVVIGLVISLELINSAIENLVDLVTREQMPLAGKIKDLAAGAVLIFSVIAFCVGCIIFGKYILNCF